MDKYDRQNSRDAAEELHAAIMRTIQRESNPNTPDRLPPDQVFLLIAELKCLYFEMLYVDAQPVRMD